MFGGSTYRATLDQSRLHKQLARVRDYLLEHKGTWADLQDCPVALPGEGTAAITARARDLRKKKFGFFVVECRRKPGTTTGSLYEYRIPWRDGQPLRRSEDYQPESRAQVTTAILFNLKKKTIDKTCCDANRCTEHTHSTVPGDLWARDEVGLCARHIALAATFAEQNPDYAPVVETPASTALVKAPADGVLLPPTWGERVTAIIAQVQSDVEVAELTLKEAQALNIESRADMDKATDLVRDVKTMRDDIETWEKEVTRPVNAVAKRIRELLNPAKVLWSKAEVELRSKLSKAALREHDRNQQIMQEAARTHADGGDVTPVMEQLTTSTDLDGVSIKIVWKATVQDVSLLPDEYVIRLPDNKKLKDYAASFEGAEPTPVPGVLFERDAPTRVQGR